MNRSKLEEHFDELVKKNGGKELTIEQRRMRVETLVEQHNSRPLEAFEWYSPNEMSIINNATLSTESVVQFQPLSDDLIRKMPIIQQVRHLFQILKSTNGLKLTVKGNLPTKIVKELYDLGAGDQYFNVFTHKVIFEQESLSVSLVRALLTTAGYIKKRHNKLELTIKGNKMADSDNQTLLTELLKIRCQNMDWRFFEFIEDDEYENIGSTGWAFVLILVSKYGEQMRDGRFYIEKFFKAFPLLVDDYEAFQAGLKRDTIFNHSLCGEVLLSRVFLGFLKPFGLVKIVERGSIINDDATLLKTPLFDMLVKIVPPRGEEIN